MARIKEFRGLRPRKDLAPLVSELPYDVVDSETARAAARGNRYSFFHISKPEVDLPEGVDHYDDRVYDKGRENLERFRSEGTLGLDEQPLLYLYTQIMEGREQTGLVSCIHIDDYVNSIIKKHELTREDKEVDRTKHLDRLSANAGLVFLLYREEGDMGPLFREALKIEPEYDFTSNDGIRHIFRVIRDPGAIDAFKKGFRDRVLYIADGHHRAASGVKVGLRRRQENPGHTGQEEYNWFLAVIFPHTQLKIMAYNRVVKDLHGASTTEFMDRLRERFSIEKTEQKVPAARHRFCMYIEKQWYLLTPAFTIKDDPIGSLDVKILQDSVLDPMLGIGDPRTDKRIDFIGGIKGTGELEQLVDGGAYRVAFSLHPTSLVELMRVSDTGGIMPPKSTWFEPKLRSGLVMHLL